MLQILLLLLLLLCIIIIIISSKKQDKDHFPHLSITRQARAASSWSCPLCDGLADAAAPLPRSTSVSSSRGKQDKTNEVRQRICCPSWCGGCQAILRRPLHGSNVAPELNWFQKTPSFVPACCYSWTSLLLSGTLDGLQQHNVGRGRRTRTCSGAGRPARRGSVCCLAHSHTTTRGARRWYFVMVWCSPPGMLAAHHRCLAPRRFLSLIGQVHSFIFFPRYSHERLTK